MQPALLPSAANSIVADARGLVAVGMDGSVATSPDGVDWRAQAAPTTADLFGVAFGNDEYVAVGQMPGSLATGPGVGVILTSHDGVVWTLEASGAIAGDRISGIVWSGNRRRRIDADLHVTGWPCVAARAARTRGPLSRAAERRMERPQVRRRR